MNDKTPHPGKIEKMDNIQTREALKKYKLAPHKKLGQNFLIRQDIANSIIQHCNITDNDRIVEVGVGFGALTSILAEHVDKVIGIELDSGLINYYRNNKIFSENVTIYHQDILKADFEKLQKQVDGKIKIVANLPYSISNPFIFKLIENRNCIDWVVVMLQKEMAERLLAKPSTKQYGIPTVLLAAYADIEKLMIVKPYAFHPQPKIDSMVVRIAFRQSHNSCQSENYHSLFQQIVRGSFAQRRKTLLNNLSNLPDTLFQSNKSTPKKDYLQSLLIQCDIHPQERAENLTVSQFHLLTRTFMS